MYERSRAALAGVMRERLQINRHYSLAILEEDVSTVATIQRRQDPA
jgi:hypothetical protein